MRKFSKLKKQIESLFEPSLKMEFCCYSYPVRSQHGSSSIPRFCVKLDGEVIWDYPKDFAVKEIDFHLWAGDNNISQLVRDYIDAPLEGLLERKFENETKEYNLGILEYKPFSVTYNLTDLFKAADRRLGRGNLQVWALKSKNVAVWRIYINRYELREWYRKNLPISFREMSILGLEGISRQKPTTLAEKRAQFLRVRGDFRTNEEALAFVNTLSEGEYICYVNGVNLPNRKQRPE